MQILARIVRHSIFKNYLGNGIRFSFSNTALDNDFAAARPYEEIPKIRSFPIVRSTWVYFPFIGKYDIFKLQDTDLKKYREYGKIIREDVGMDHELLLLYDPNDIEKMYRYEGRYPSRTTFKTIEHYKTLHKDHNLAGLFSSKGQTWYDLRSKLQKHVTKPDLVAFYLPDVNAICKEFLNKVNLLADFNREVPDLLKEINKFALEVVVLYALDKHLGMLKPDIPEDSDPMKVLNSLGDMFQGITDLEFGPEMRFKYFPSKTWRKLVEALNTFNSFTKKHLDEILEQILKEDDEQRKSSVTLLETFVRDEKMDRVQAVTVVNDLMLAGTLVTSHTLAFTLYLLACHPECQEKVYQEIVQCFAGTSQITTSGLNEMRYLKACVKESMRVMPVIAFNRRQIPQDIVLSGYKVPAGTVCVAQALALCLMEENFPEAKKFKPERWLNKDKKETHPFAFLPFGFGPRNCVGRRIVEQAMWTFVAEVVRNYKMEYHHEKIDLITKFIHHPDKPVKIKFIKRE